MDFSFILSWKFLAGAILALSPVLSYGDTIWSIYSTKQCAGFSLDLTAIMLISSILRVFFYFGEPYETSLLVQAVLMIIVQVLLLYLVLKYRVVPVAAGAVPLETINKNNLDDSSRNRARSSSTSVGYIPDINGPNGNLLNPEEPSMSHRKSFSDTNQSSRLGMGHNKLLPVLESEGENFGNENTQNEFNIVNSRLPFMKQITRQLDVETLKRQYASYSTRPLGFWQWVNPIAYWAFLAKFTIVLTVLQLCVGTWSMFYVQTVGLVGLLLEAFLPLPQLIHNHQRHSVKGFRLSLLANWLGGDASKMFYYLYGTTDSKKLAPQFVICVIIQTVLDLLAGCQYYYYNHLYMGPHGGGRARGLSFQLPVFSVPNKSLPLIGASQPTYQPSSGSGPTRDSVELEVVPFPDYISKPVNVTA